MTASVLKLQIACNLTSTFYHQTKCEATLNICMQTRLYLAICPSHSGQCQRSHIQCCATDLHLLFKQCDAQRKVPLPLVRVYTGCTCNEQASINIMSSIVQFNNNVNNLGCLECLTSTGPKCIQIL